jgi:hypothetical protein
MVAALKATLLETTEPVYVIMEPLDRDHRL